MADRPFRYKPVARRFATVWDSDDRAGFARELFALDPEVGAELAGHLLEQMPDDDQREEGTPATVATSEATDPDG